MLAWPLWQRVTVVFNPLQDQAAGIVLCYPWADNLSGTAPQTTQRKGGAEEVPHRLFHFLPSSGRNRLSALLNMFLSYCLAPE